MGELSNEIDAAFALLREGKAVEAEELLIRALRAAEANHGRGSPAWTAAQCDLGNLLMVAGRSDDAIKHYRAACVDPAPAEPEALKEHLTYLSNLGIALRQVGRLDEAEAELRRGVDERYEFYGHEHAGFAFGLEPLADLLLERGEFEEAAEVIEETVDVFWHNGHPRVAGAAAIRAEIRVRAGSDEPPFGDLEGLPDELFAEMADALIGRAGRGDPASREAVLTALVAALEARLGQDHQATLNALSALANVARDSGNGQARVEAIRKVLASYDRQERVEDALMTSLGLALAQDQVGDLDGALRTYEAATLVAKRIGDQELLSQVLRNWGLALAQADRRPEAEQRLRDAVGVARKGSDPESLGSGEIALGLFLQHQGDLDEARPLIEAALGRMNPAHPDAVVARSHLNAITTDGSCGCGDMGDALAESFRAFVIGRIQPDLLEDFAVEVRDGDFKIDVRLRREPAEEELEHLQRVVDAALAEFRQRLLAAR